MEENHQKAMSRAATLLEVLQHDKFRAMSSAILGDAASQHPPNC